MPSESALPTPARGLPAQAGLHRLPLHAGPQLVDLLERATGACVWLLELSPSRIQWSPRSARLLGLTSAPGTDEAWTDPLYFYAPESRVRMAAALGECMAHGAPFDEEVQILTAAGAALWVRATGEALGDAAGNVLRIQGLFQDLSAAKQAENEAMGVTMRLSTTLASLREAFVTLDRKGRFNYVNIQGEQILQQHSKNLLGRELWSVLSNSAHERLFAEIRRVMATGHSVEFEEFSPQLGKWLELRAHSFEEGVALYLRDVTAARQAQEQMMLLQTSISHLNDSVMITDADTQPPGGQRIVFVNDAFERLTGYGRHEVMGRTPRILQGPLTQKAELDRIRQALQACKPVKTELINYKRNGDAFWIELDIVPVEHASRGLTHWVCVARDITERKAAVDEIEHLAFYDVLTQLPNRKLLMDRLEATLAQGVEHVGIGVLMFIDLDHFKLLNDTLGHSRGDMLLQQVAQRLSSCLRLSDTVARLGGDEFVVMLEDLGTDNEQAKAYAISVAEKILAKLSEPHELAGHEHHGTCSIGLTSFSRQRQSVGDLLKQADLAMYQAKAMGRNALCFFDPSMQATATANAALSADLRRGLHEGEFILHYQPQVGHDQRMFGVEALLRWQHPQRGLVQPGDFIAQAEESGLILALGRWVLETACAQLAAWAKRPETAHLTVAVNVSVRQFRHPEFVDQVMAIITGSGIAAKRLQLELTESLLATDIDISIAKMSMLKDAGVTLSIDDFGMGYSALSYLKHLPLDQLKIDRTFVKDILTDPNDAAIARTIIGLAQSLGLGVTAEGVENEAQRALLQRFGCESFQGYLYCGGLPIDALEVFMAGFNQAVEPPVNQPVDPSANPTALPLALSQ